MLKLPILDGPLMDDIYERPRLTSCRVLDLYLNRLSLVPLRVAHSENVIAIATP